MKNMYNQTAVQWITVSYRGRVVHCWTEVVRQILCVHNGRFETIEIRDGMAGNVVQIQRYVIVAVVALMFVYEPQCVSYLVSQHALCER